MTWTTRRRAHTLAALALAITMLTGVGLAGPASATPTPTPTPAAGAASKPAPSAGQISWAVQPSTANGPDRRSAFRYTNLAAGTVVHDYVSITNFSTVPVSFTIYATDAFTTSSGTLDMLAGNVTPTDVGAWVKMSKKTITLAPSARANEPFTLTIPATASPGDHTGGIVASVSIATTTASGSKVNVDRRLAVPILLRVTGALHSQVTVESLTIGGFRGTANPIGGGASSVSFTVHNTGNVRLNVAQVIKVTGPFGIDLTSANAPALSDLLPGATVRVRQRVTGVFPAGPLTVRIHLTPTELKEIPSANVRPAAVDRAASLWATPIPQLALVALIVLLVYAIKWWRSHARRALEGAVARARREALDEVARAGATTS
jgi:hypothetical protein